MTSTENNNDSSTIISTANQQHLQQFTNNNYVTELISNGIIPKIGSIVKRFSLNYSGEGLVTDRERVRVVRVGIRFQVQVDSFLNRGATGRPRAVLRATSTPEISNCDNRIDGENRALVSSLPVNNSTSANFLDRISALNFRNSQTQRDNRRSVSTQELNTHPQHQLHHFHHTEDQQQRLEIHRNYDNRRNAMEDSSSYQVLRHFPGSNVTSFRELNWETAAFEQQVREWVQWVGDKATSSKLPPLVQGILNSAKNYAKENPLTAITFLTLLATCALPIFGFLAFAVATILFTFIGFLFVEGTVLTVATVLLGGVLVVIALATISVLVVGLLGYFFTSQVFNLLKGHKTISSLLRHIPIVGHLFANPQEYSERNGYPKDGSRQLAGRPDSEDEDEEYDSIPYEINEDHDDTYEHKTNNGPSIYTNGDAPNGEILSHTD